jgi:RNA polymerase sigma factor (sigma-70 family)
MPEVDDNDLLKEYVEQDSEHAFATLVNRHVNKVYSVALRHTGNPHQAEEITQAVFVILAKKSRQLSNRVVLSGWLHHTARLASVTFLRSEIRRARREEKAHMQNVLNQGEHEVWPQIAPLLDSALASLSEKDRHAVLLRFFDDKSIGEVAAALGTSEGASRKRVDRALERLRTFFARRGLVLTTAVMAGAISAQSVQAAPAVLAETATAVALANGTTASASIMALVKGSLKMMAWNWAKPAAITAAVAMLAAAPILTIVSGITSSPVTASGFSPEIYRTVNSDDPERYGQNYIDFDTGGQPAKPQGANELNWMQRTGADGRGNILGWRDSTNGVHVVPGMMGVDMTVIPVSNDEWENITPARLHQRLAVTQPQSPTRFSDGTIATLSSIGGKDGLPLTYVFKTREGAEGILQITGYTDPLGNLNIHPRGVNFRYKLAPRSRRL